MAALIAATAGALAGHIVAPIDTSKYIDFRDRMLAARIGYEMGAKDPNVGSGKIGFTHLDCSAFVRTLARFAAGGALNDMPDGSWNEDDYFAARGFKRSQYLSVFDGDDILRACIHRPNGRGSDPTGHIWFAVHGHSDECYGGHGVGQRPLDHQWFVDHVDDVWCVAELTATHPITPFPNGVSVVHRS